MENLFLFFIECVGVISFSISGTIIAIQKRLDFIGAAVFALLTSFGGGLLRDLTTGVTPPLLLTSAEFRILAIVSIVSSTVVFQLAFYKGFASHLVHQVHNLWIELTDSVGLAAFCVLGVDSSLTSNPDFAGDAVLLIFCGCITGVGGGVLRDVMSAEIPALFRKHVYLIPALIGTAVYVFMLPLNRRVLSYCVSMSVILAIRLLALKFHWNFPTPLKGKRRSAASTPKQQEYVS